jgi:molybdopterin/thiamine biosynthesis adenylyltransferase
VKLPRIKPAHDPFRENDGTIRLGGRLFGVGSELRDSPDGSVWKLIRLLDGSRELEAVVADMCREDPELDGQSVRDSVRALIEMGFVEDAGASTPPGLSVAELERYASNTGYFAWVDKVPRATPHEYQRLLKQAKVSLLGLGGAGSAVAMSLVAAGVGSLLCADFDVVELGNLNRQLLYTEDDVGAPKVETAVRRLSRINRHVDVVGRTLEVRSTGDLLPLMDADLFILCADTPYPEIQLWTNDAALTTRTPWLVSQYVGPMTLTTMFLPYRTPCFRCVAELHPAVLGRGEDIQRMYPQQGHAVIAPTAILSGQLAVLEALYHLTGMPTQTAGRVFRQNLLVYDHNHFADLEFSPGCPSCGGGRSSEAQGAGRPACP